MQTLGEKLSEARQRIGARIQDVAEATHIRKDYIDALENNQFDLIPLAEVYRRGYVKIYARHLRLDPAAALRDYENTAAAAGIPTGEAGAVRAGASRHVSSGVYGDDASGSYEQDAARGGDEHAGGAPGAGVGSSLFSPGKRPPRPASGKTSFLWLYILLGLLAIVGVGLALRYTSSGKRPSATEKPPAAPTLYSYKMVVSANVDTKVTIVQQKDKKVLLERNIGPSTPVTLFAEGPVEVHSKDIQQVFVVQDGWRHGYDATTGSVGSFTLTPRPPAPRKAPSPPANGAGAGTRSGARP